MFGGGVTGVGVALVMLLLPLANADVEPIVERGGGDAGTVGTTIAVPGTGPRSARGATSAAPAIVDQGPAPCSYRSLTPEEALKAGLLSPDDGGVENLPASGGEFVLRDCSASGGGRLVMWVPEGEGTAAAPAGALLVTPAMLAQEARNILQLPEPAVGVSPDGLNENPALVNLPTWWWVTNGEPLTQRTSLGAVWVEVTAEAVASTWTTSDGDRSECAGVGFAWAPGMGDLEPGSCSHTYTHANADEQAQVEVVWRVTWVGSGGSGGTLEPLILTTTLAVPVYERHAIVTWSG